MGIKPKKMVKYTIRTHPDVEKSYLVQYVNDEKSLKFLVL